MKQIVLLATAASMMCSLNAKAYDSLFMYAYDKAGAENNYIELTTDDGDMYSATGNTFTNSATDLSGVQVVTADWSTVYCPDNWPEVKLNTVLDFDGAGGNGQGGWIWGWTLSESNYIYFQKSTKKFVISANSDNPIIIGEPGDEYTDLSLYAYDVTNEANINIPMSSKDGIIYTATGYAFPAGAIDGYKGIQVHNADWTEIYAPADETYPAIVKNEPITLVLGGTGEAWITDWCPEASDTFTFNKETGALTISGETSVTNIFDDNETSDPIYYNLQGIRVMNPSHGIYIKCQGSKTTKIRFTGK
ncbi:MAG: hypothetical protein LUC85_10480 [Bacteroidales bacterium]|nr:hypothetical protein [Bacteroidales bacterium]MCD8395234.1 hypothetical protein [Bacteroidales bacterium]